jgi:putative ABC transport system permease protein
MLKVTWRNLVARKVRLFLSALAIVLGVAFVAGSFIITDTIGSSFDDIIEGTTADVEIAYEGTQDFDSVSDSRLIPAAVVNQLQSLPEVGSVHPNLQLQTVFVIGKNGKVVGGNGPPGLAFNPNDATAITGNPVNRLVEGRAPDAPHEIDLDVDTADKADYQVGDKVKLATPGKPPVIEATLVGLVEAANGAGINGATITIFDTAFMQKQFFGGQDGYTNIQLNAAAGVSQAQLRDAAQKVLPKGVQARTGREAAAKVEKELDTVIGYIRTVLLVFAGVSLFVAIFIIVNTFSILVAQRARELALLRTLGASRRQLTWSVIFEAAVVGLIGSTLGVVVGVGLAHLLAFVFALAGLDLGQSNFPLKWTTVLWSYLVGVIVTMVAAYFPARRASRVPPVQALRDDIALPETALRRRLLIGGVLVLLGIAGIVGGFAGSGATGLSLIGLGMAVILVGAALLSPVASRPVILVFAVPYRRLFGPVGRLASQNSLRNPRRTAATASALMVGLALVSLMSVFARSAAASTDVAVAEGLSAQLIVSNVVSQPFSTDVAAQIGKVDGVEAVAAVRFGSGEIDGNGLFTGAIDPREFMRALAIPAGQGSFTSLTNGGIAVLAPTAEHLGLQVGDHVELKMQGGTVPLTVAMIYPKTPTLPYEALVTFTTFKKGALAPLDSIVFVREAAGADPAAIRSAVEQIVSDLPTVTVKDPQGYADEQKAQINGLLNFFYGLLALSVVIAILGVVNTLGLSVIERTREIGLLRAIGMSRRQLRTMIRLESVVIAVFGALLGVALGIAFGVGLIKALHDQGLTELSIPWFRLAIFVVAAGAVGVVAAALPARRAARLDVLKAIATE